MTSLRFFAALTVFFFHVHEMGLVGSGQADGVVAWLFGAGAAGVSFFFILRGFVLTWSVRPDDTAMRFWRRRFVKIFPNHAVAWVVALPPSGHQGG